MVLLPLHTVPSVVHAPPLDVSVLNCWLDAQGKRIAHSQSDGSRHWLTFDDHAVFTFTDDASHVTGAPMSATSVKALRATYNKNALPLIMQSRGCQVLHASAVITSAGVVAICGQREAGKSTFAYELGLRGREPWSDDAVVWLRESADVFALRLPLALAPRPRTDGITHRESRLKAPAFHDGQIHRLAAVIVLSTEQSANAKSIEKLLPNMAFRTLLQHANAFDGRSSGQVRLFSDYVKFCARVPIYEVSIRHANLDDAVTQMDEWLECIPDLL